MTKLDELEQLRVLTKQNHIDHLVPIIHFEMKLLDETMKASQQHLQTNIDLLQKEIQEIRQFNKLSDNL